MKILLISDLYPIDETDKTIPLVIESFVSGFMELNHKIEVIRPNFLLNTFFRKHKIYKEEIYFKNNVKIYNKNFILPFLNKNISYLKEKYDLIISHMPSGHIYANLINKQLKLPHISIVHQSDWEVLNNKLYYFYFKKQLKQALANSTLTGARNNFLKKELNADFILPSFIDKTFIIDRKTHNNEKIKIITLSKLIKRKNIDKIITALNDVDFDFEYNIFGEGKEKNKLIQLIKGLKLENKIKIHSHINHNLIFSELDKHDIFILTSEKESFGVCYLEAMARGLITICTKNTGIDGIIENNKNGFIIKPDKNEISAVLNKINKMSKKEKEELSQKTLQNIKNYEKNIIMKKYVENIKKIL